MDRLGKLKLKDELADKFEQIKRCDSCGIPWNDCW